MRLTLSIQIYSDLELFVMLGDDDAVYQKSQVSITDRAFPNDLLDQVNAFLHLRFAFFDSRAVIGNGVDFLFQPFNIILAELEHFGVDFLVFFVAYAFEQYILLVGHTLIERPFQLCELVADVAFLIHPTLYIRFDRLIICHRPVFDVEQLLVNQLVEHGFIDPVRSAVVLAIAVITGTVIFEAVRQAIPTSYFTYEIAATLLTFQQSRVTVTGFTRARPHVFLLFMLKNSLYLPPFLF